MVFKYIETNNQYINLCFCQLNIPTSSIRKFCCKWKFYRWFILSLTKNHNKKDLALQLGQNLYWTIFKKCNFWVKKLHSFFYTSIPGQICYKCSQAIKGHIWLVKFNDIKLCLVIYFIHITQLSLFSEYLTIVVFIVYLAKKSPYSYLKNLPRNNEANHRKEYKKSQ